MTSLLAIEKTISSFQELHDRLGLVRSSDDTFFQEWQNLTIAPSAENKRFLDALQHRYRYYYNSGLLTEGTILLSIVAPLLENIGFHEPPFFVQSEVSVSLEVKERDEIYRGRIDVLVIWHKLWVLIVEAKNSKFAADLALPQCLSYMSASSEPRTFGMVTNGTDFIFCKLVNSLYDFSEPFSLLSRQNRFYEIAEILSTIKASAFCKVD
jgi:hypothetical protein